MTSVFIIFALVAGLGFLACAGRKRTRTSMAMLFCLLASGAAVAQTSSELQPQFPRFEVGAGASGIYREASNVSAGSTPGLGGRFVYNLYVTQEDRGPSILLSLEADLHFFPMNETPTTVSGGNGVAGLFGAKLGLRGSRWGGFVKFRPGFVSYSNAIVGGTGTVVDPFRTGRFTNPAIDVGAVLEYYPAPTGRCALTPGIPSSFWRTTSWAATATR